MRILHIINYYQDGMGYQENWLPYHQKKLGHEVEISTSDKYFPFPNYENTVQHKIGDRQRNFGIFTDKGIKIHRFKGIFEIKNRAIIFFNFLEHLFVFKPQVIHLHGITNLNLFFLLPYVIFRNSKLFIDSHTDYQVVRHQSIANKIYYCIWMIIYKILDPYIEKYLPITNESKVFLQKELKISDSKIRINFLGADTKSFNFNSTLAVETKKQLAIKDEIILINAGKQYKEKKIDFIINLTKELIEKKSGTNFKLILIGSADKDYDSFIEDQIKNITEHVIRIPFVENKELVKYYSIADIGIWPGIPSNTIQEAMACETALILPKNDTVSHLIDDNGFFITDEINLLVDKIHNSILNNNLTSLKKNSRTLVQNYSWKNIAKDAIKIYEEN